MNFETFKDIKTLDIQKLKEYKKKLKEISLKSEKSSDTELHKNVHNLILSLNEINEEEWDSKLSTIIEDLSANVFNDVSYEERKNNMAEITKEINTYIDNKEEKAA